MKQAERYLNEGLHPRVIVEVSSSSMWLRLCFACTDVKALFTVQQGSLSAQPELLFTASESP